MNINVIKGIEKFDEIIDKLGKDYRWKNAFGQMVPYFEYYNTDYDENNQPIPTERALEDRDKMIAVLRYFYSKENTNDFVTIFAIYCNNYIRYNMHRCLKDEDFAIKELWDVVVDENIRIYMSLIQKGISEQKIEYFKGAVEILYKYSTPYLYLFIHAIRERINSKNTTDDEMIDEQIITLYEKMDEDFRKYVLQKNEYMRCSLNPAIDENLLPYFSFYDIPFYYSLIDNDFSSDLDNSDEYKQDRLISRLTYLNIPVFIPKNLKNRIEALLKPKIKIISDKEKLEEVCAQLDRLNKRNTAMVRRNSHIWTNILYPDIVLNIAKKLQIDEQYKDDAKKLMFAYNNENMMKQQITMLELRHSNNITELKTQLRNGIASEEDCGKNVVNIDSIVNSALERVLFRILMDESKRSEDIRRDFSLQNNDIDKLRISFEQNVIIGGISSLKWMNENLFRLVILQDDIWKSIKLRQNSYNTDLLAEIFMEIFLNMLTYGSKEWNYENMMNFDSEIINDVEFIRIGTCNSINHLYGKYDGGTKEGLASLEDVLQMVNTNYKGENILDKYIEINNENEVYSSSILIRKDLFKEVVY